MVEVQKLRTVYDFCWPRATLCGDSRGRGSKTEDFLRFLLAARDPLRRFAWSRFKKLRSFYDFCGARAALCGDSRGRGSKTTDFLRSAGRARPSAEIRLAEVQKLTTFYDFYCARAKNCGLFCDFCGARAHPLRGSCASKRSRCGAVRICLSLGEPSAEIVRVEALSLWRRAFFLLAKRPLEVVSWFARLLSQCRGRGFDSPLVRGSSGLKIAAFKYKRSTRSVLLQLRLENRNF